MHDSIAAAVLVAWAVAYYALFGGMTLTEDTGFYGYLARCVRHGAVLHRDIPVATNSVGIYLTAALFRFFGPSVAAIRLFHLAGLWLLLLAVYLLLSRRLDWRIALGGALVTGVFVADPALALDLGRNYIYWGLASVALGIFFDQGMPRTTKSMVASGAAFGLAAVFRETFIVFAGVYWLFLCVESLLDRSSGASVTTRWRAPLWFAVGASCALGADVILLLAQGTLLSYLRDVLVSGGGVRYHSGLLSWERLSGNFNMWLLGDWTYNVPLLIPVFAVAAVSYLMGGRDRLAGALRFALVPAALFEALVVNQTFTYHVQPLAVFTSILAVLVLESMRRRAWSEGGRAGSNRGRQRARWVLGVLLCVLAFGLYAALRMSYLPVAQSVAKATPPGNRAKWASSPTNMYALASLLDAVPARRVAEFAQWQILLLTRRDYPVRPFIDMSAPGYLGRPDLGDRIVRLTRDGKIDLIAFKSAGGSYLTRAPGAEDFGGQLGTLAAERYYFLADFGQDTLVEFFTGVNFDRILIRRGLVSKYHVVSTRTVKLGGPGSSHSVDLSAPVAGGPYFVLVRPSSPLPDSSYSLRVGRSLVTYRDVYSDQDLVSSFVAGGHNYSLAVASSLATPTPFTIETRAIR